VIDGDAGTASTRADAADGGVAEAEVDVVLKVGGALMRDRAAFGRAVGELARLRRDARIVLVPGGGLFADAVREADRRLRVGDDAAHWMAVLAMDQYAHLLGASVSGALVIDDPVDLDAAFAGGHVPVLAPYRWLRRADPLPHSWDVTSDSIAAWVASRLRATHLVLLKPAVGPLSQTTDGYFVRARSAPTAAVPIVRLCTARDARVVVASLTITSPDRGRPH
jgi:aspartokinase-like uncharacterized kinase